MEIRSDYYINKSSKEYSIRSSLGREFEELIDKLNGGKMAQEIRENYNVTLDVGGVGDFGILLNRYDFRCKNYVGISQQTLRRMENDSVLKNKVLHAIEEFCSPEEQAKINALYPPVKSAGMIVHPDGKVLYWLEGYPNEYDVSENKKKIVCDETIVKVQTKYLNQQKDATDKYAILYSEETLQYQRKLQKKQEERETEERREHKERMEEALEEYIKYRRELREYYNEVSYQKKLAVSNPEAVPVVGAKRPPVVSAAYEMMMLFGM